MIRKIDLMHKYFGKTDYKCGDCNNLIWYDHHGRNYKKCRIYGLSHSEATDWALRWQSCGKYNQEYTGKEIVKMVKRETSNEDVVLPGQMHMDLEE